MCIVNEQESSLIGGKRHGFILFRFCDVEIPVIPVFIRGAIRDLVGKGLGEFRHKQGTHYASSIQQNK
jgi:hypothetical protein